MNAHETRNVRIPMDGVQLDADLTIPQDSRGAVLFAHGSGSSRHSPRNRYVAEVLQNAGFSTLLLDLLTESEEILERDTAALRFNIPFLANRLLRATEWLKSQSGFEKTSIGYFGASTGAAAALVAAAQSGGSIHAVVSRGGRPDLAGETLAVVQCPTLLIVGGDDTLVLDLNREALSQVQCEKKLEIVAHATHLFEEPGTLEQVAALAREWFMRYLGRREDNFRAA